MDTYIIGLKCNIESCNEKDICKKNKERFQICERRKAYKQGFKEASQRHIKELKESQEAFENEINKNFKNYLLAGYCKEKLKELKEEIENNN